MTTTPVKAPAIVLETRKFTVAEYFRMVEAGVLQPRERVELIEGEILLMPPMGHPHRSGVTRYTRVFGRLAGERFSLMVQVPLRLDEHSAPEPDLALLKFREDDYLFHQEVPEDVLLVIEIADSSLTYDREIKAHVYGRAGIPEAWVVNLTGDCIERFREPGPNGYAQHTILRRGERVTPVSLPEIELAVADLLLPPTPAEPGQEPGNSGTAAPE